MIRKEISKLIGKSIKELQKEKKLPKFKIPEILVEKPREKSHGDYSVSGVVFKISEITKEKPLKIAKEIKPLEKYPYKNIKIVNPAFINFFISEEYLQKEIREILKQGEKFGDLKIGKNRKINVEFISSNPTGPLHIGNGRGGFCGDVLSNILEKAGYKVEREYYINDMGRQIKILENSLLGRKPSYRNQYIDELRKKGEKNVKKAVDFIVGKIKKTVKKIGIKFDNWFYESDLYRKKEMDRVINLLKKKKLIYDKDGVLWFKSTKFGDDKDRALTKKDSKTPTYFLSDILYLKNKFERKFDKLIIFLGAEHHGYIKRLRAGAEALGYKKDKVNPIIMQLVKLVRGKRQVRMSKRKGVYVTLDDLIKEVGPNVARFFFLTRSYDSHLNFDLDLAKEQSNKNPVYYVQYAYARICSILSKFGKFKIPSIKLQINSKLKLLIHKSELELVKQLIRFPEIIEDTVKDYQVQRLPQYAIDLADSFHKFYENCRVISEDKELTQARLSLIQATKIVLKNTLNLMGISAPEKM